MLLHDCLLWLDTSKNGILGKEIDDGKQLKESFWLIPLLEQQDWADATRLWKMGKTKNDSITFLSQRRERVILLAVQI